MKTLLIALVSISSLFASTAQARQAPLAPGSEKFTVATAPMIQADTLLMKLGDDSKIIVVVKNDKDLDIIRKYDLNKMVEDMQFQIDEKTGQKVLVIDDATGQKYLKSNTGADNDEAFSDPWWGDQDKGGDWNVEFHTKNKDKDDGSRTHHFMNFELGLDNYVNGSGALPSGSEPYAIRPIKSWTYAINSVNRTSFGKVFNLEYGLGISWYNFRFDDNSYRIEKGATQVEFNQVPGVEYDRSKLNITYINATLVPVFYLGQGHYGGSDWVSFDDNDGFRFGVGGYAGYRIGSKSKFIYSENGDGKKDKNKTNFYLNNFRYGVRAQIGWKGIDLFANYDLNKLFEAGKGPDLQAFSFGITL